MNSKCRTILGVMMLAVIFGISAYFIVSELSGAGRTDEQNVTLTNETQKNYLSPIGVNSLIIDKSEVLTAPIELFNMERSLVSQMEGKISMRKLVSGAYTLQADLADQIRSIGTLMYPLVKTRLMEKALEDAAQTYALMADHHDTYVQNKSQQELESTTHHLFDNLFVTNDSIIEEYLNIRDVPGGNIIGRMYPQTGGTLLDMQDGWAMISSGEVTGWVDMQYILTGTQVAQSGVSLWAVVDEDRLMLRYEANVDSVVMDILTKGTVVSFEDYSAGWVHVTHKDMTGYLKAEYVHLQVGVNTAVPMSAELWNETLGTADTAQQPQAEEPVQETQAAEPEVLAEAPAPAAAPAAVEPSADDLARQRIDALYAEGRSAMAPIYLSADEIYLLSCVIMMEAGNENYEGKLAVAGVVMNRLRSGYWGSTLHEVIYAPKQFTGAGTGLLANYMASGPNEESVRAAYEACAGIHNIGDYLYFCSVKSARYEEYTNYLVIQGQCFYAK